MSFYPLLPSPHEAETFAYWEKGFTESDCQSICRIGDALDISKATIGDNQDNPNIRRSKTSWINCNKDTEWIYDKLGYIVRQLNGQYFGFNITGFGEDLQYTVYEGSDKGHYDYHQDSGNMTGRAPRKLSIVLQLSSPDEYEGGELQLLTGTEPTIMRRELGFVVVFPSFILHRVTPITSGMRKSLVAWLTGPRFI